ncbi:MULTISPECIES: chemotaxis protein CheW [Microvirga]|uniref:chemotaxis protein CheW n=1 Tax=Microvirga TaxID=186650 RepID=UPI001CFFC0BF|nr:chemotaxis protein CheW [Microvirga lenta]MCB5175078.1 chemotaxis protein CheW [Microvirga lenta]
MASLQVILFDVSGIACALRRHSVKELLPLPRLWHPPGLPRPVAGFFNLSGAAVPVVRLDVLFGLQRREGATEADLYRHLILIDKVTDSGPAAFLVDRVLDVTDVGEAQLSPVRPENSLNGCVEAEIDRNGRLVHLLSLERVLFAEEKQVLDELGRNAQSRLNEWTVPA